MRSSPRIGRRRMVVAVADGWSARLLLVAVALGLVLMHHLVAAHQHTPEPTPVAGQAAVGHTLPVADADPTAFLHVHHDGHGVTSSTLHDCLAILAPVAALVVLLALVRRFATLLGPASSGLLARREPARGPPLPRRLSQLQVLRL